MPFVLECLFNFPKFLLKLEALTIFTIFFFQSSEAPKVGTLGSGLKSGLCINLALVQYVLWSGWVWGPLISPPGCLASAAPPLTAALIIIH